MDQNLPSIFDYLKFSTFFSAYMRARSESDQVFSYRFLAKKLELKSTSILAAISAGTRRPSPDLLIRMLRVLQFSDEEIAAAQIMIDFENASSLTQRQYYLEKLEQIRPYSPLKIIPKHQFDLWARWYNVPILESVNLLDFVEDADWLRNRIDCEEWPTDDPLVVLQELEEAGYLTRDANGKLVQSVPRISTQRFFTDATIFQFHAQLLERAKRAIFVIPADKRHVSSVSLAIDPSNLAEARNLITKFETDIVKLLQKKPGKEVYHLAIQLFPLTTPDEEGEHQSSKPLNQ